MNISSSQYFAILLIIVLKIVVVNFPRRYKNFSQLNNQLFCSPLYWLLIFLTHVAYVCLLPSQIYLQLSDLDFLTLLCFLLKTVGLTPFTGVGVSLYVLGSRGLFLLPYILLGGVLIQSGGFIIISLITGTLFLGFWNFLIAWFILNVLTIFIWSSLFSYSWKSVEGQGLCE